MGQTSNVIKERWLKTPQSPQTLSVPALLSLSYALGQPGLTALLSQQQGGLSSPTFHLLVCKHHLFLFTKHAFVTTEVPGNRIRSLECRHLLGELDTLEQAEMGGMGKGENGGEKKKV